MNQHLETLWQAYREHVVPSDAGECQITETRRAFFSGAVSLFTLVTKGLSPGTEVAQRDLDMMDSLHAELDAFNVSQGMAPGRLRVR